MMPPAAAIVLGLLGASACATARNYPSPLGPRYAGAAADSGNGTAGAAPDGIRIVTLNIRHAQRVDRAIELLRSAEPLQGADIIALQEMDAGGTERIARALRMAYVYYPAAVHWQTGRDFGNAILSRWPIVSDAKIVLPHLARFRRLQRVATAATVLVGGVPIRVYSVHLATRFEVGPGSRRRQVRAILSDAAPFPRVIVSGDMNSHGIGEEFQAAGYLWPTERNPPTRLAFRWDHIFLKGLAPRDTAATGVVARNLDASDHRPVWAVGVMGSPSRRGRIKDR